MGLDMYLKATRYASDFEFISNEEREAFRLMLAGSGLDRSAVSADHPSITCEVTVLYWRKANAIHGWFVDNVQGGKDECQTAYVPREKLTELRDMCQKCLDFKEAKLPPRPGFFFGSSEVDQWYWLSIEETAKALTCILDNPAFKRWGFQYHASW